MCGYNLYPPVPDLSEPPEVTKETEELDAMVWYRLGRFEELGFSYPVSLELALANTDWHAAERLLTGGATIRLAGEILLP